MQYILYFLLWTFVLYWVHRLTHMYPIPFVTKSHWEHHRQVAMGEYENKWHWTNIFLWTGNWKSTVDFWFTDVIPTLVFCYITDQWWIAVFYYFWAAFFQEFLEHNPKINFYPFLTSGSYHLKHHNNSKKNFGLFLPIWDILFKTHKSIKQ